MKAKSLLVSCLIAVTVANAQSPVFQWAKGMSGTITSEGKSIAVDAAGNVITTGVMRAGTVDFDPGPGTYNLTSAGQEDIFISKLDANGNFLWAKRIGNQSTDQGESVAVDAAGNVYVTGWFTAGKIVDFVPLPDDVDFDPGLGVFNLTSLGIETFVLKLDAAGNFIWAKSIEGENTEYAYDMAVDASGDVFITGTFNSTVDFDGGSGTVSLTAQGAIGQEDIFLTKWDAAGNFIWVKQMGGTGEDIPTAMHIDGSGNVLLTGAFAGTADFDPGAGVSNITSAGDFDIFMCKLDNNGNFIWVKRMGSAIREVCNGITTDLAGNILVATSFAGVFDVDPGPGTSTVATAGFNDALVCKYNANGDFLWARQWGSTGGDDVFDIKTDAAGNVYSAGSFSGTVDFEPGNAEVILTSPGTGVDIFYIRLDANGNLVWVTQLPGGGGNILSLQVNAASEIFSTGRFAGTIDFDPGLGVFNLTSSSTDIFVYKLSQGGVLPLALLGFSGQATPVGNLLQWQTAEEINTKNFEVEWSDDAQTFGKMALQKAAGNSSVLLNYTYLHYAPINGENYYRLKMVDIDGLFTYSKIILVKANINAAVITAFPNPVINLLQLNIQALKKETILFNLHSINGKIILSKSFKVVKGSNQFNWNLQSFPAGKYFISSGNNQFKTIQIIKQ